MRIMVLAFLMLSACNGWKPSPSGSAVDVLKPTAAAHARTLAGDDMAAARETGLTLLSQLAAFAGWE